MTSNRSLRLYTDAPIELREQVVRELTYCIVEGLLPILKGRVSFSSGADTRMTVSVLPSGESVKQSDLVFGVEDDRYTNIKFRDELSTACFRTLGSSSREERKVLLEKMQDWLCEITNIEEGLTLLQICAAFINQCGQKMTYDMALGLFRGFQNAAGKSLSVKNANALMTELVTYMIDNDMVTTNAVSHFAQWYLMDSSEAFRRKTDIALKQTSEDIMVALVEAILQMPTNDNVRELIDTLVKGIRSDSPALSDETRDQLTLWIIQEDASELAGFRDQVLRTYTNAKMTVLSQQILANAQDRKLNQTELAVVFRTLYQMDAPDSWFTMEDYRRLDAHMEEFQDDQTDIIVGNCLNVRVVLYPRIQDRVELLLQMSSQYPEFRTSLVKIMSQNQHDPDKMLLWEYYQTHTVFTEDVDGSQIQGLCRKYNAFMSAEGPFEKKARALWIRYVEHHLRTEIEFTDPSGDKESSRKAVTSALKRGNAMATGYLEEANRLQISQQSKDMLRSKVADIFWNLITFDHIAYGDMKVSYELLETEISGSTEKREILKGCIQIMSRPDKADILIGIIQSRKWSEAEWDKLQNLMALLACKLMSKKYFISWDLLLLSCWVEEDQFDLDHLGSNLITVEQWLKQYRISIRSGNAADSILLQNDGLRKQIRRNLSCDTTLGAKLVAELKASGKKFGARKEDAGFGHTAPAPSQPERDPRAKAGKERPGSTPQKSGNRLVQSFDEQPASQQPEKKGFFSDLRKKIGK